MGLLTMTESEREAFLADLHVGVLSVERPDGPPLTVPVWYRYTPGGAVEINTGPGSVKARLLQQAGRASLCAQREALPYAYVSVEGPVTFTASTDEDRLDIAVRYLGDEGGQAYMESTSDIDSSLLVQLTPERWFTSDYAKLG